MSTLAIIQARMSSSRLPGKVLLPLANKPVLQRICDAARRIPGVDHVVVATSNQPEDDEIADWAQSHEFDCFRGDLLDVLKRFHDVAEKYKAHTVIRITADCPLFDPQIAAALLAVFNAQDVDYCSNVEPPTWPDGLDCEIFSFHALQRAYQQATLKQDREHVTRYIRRNRHIFSAINMTCPVPGLADYRWTLDTQDDLVFLNALAEALPPVPHYTDVLDTLNKNSHLRMLNDKMKKRRQRIKMDDICAFKKSEKILARAQKTIPIGSQTFSKSRINLTPGHAPLFATHGQGGCLWDVDGNQYVDLVMGLLPVTLGYNDPDVNEAIRRQLDQGIIFSLATELEYQVAEKIVSMVPGAEKVRFGKNGTDVTSAAIRLARAFTGRDHIAVCGYHGWHDWYIGSTTRHKGVPSAVRDLTHKVAYNDLNAVEDLLKAYPDQIACLIMEPMNTTLPHENYLQDLQALLRGHGSLLVFDEVITGFRFAKGGAQEYFGITPDLTCLGKGMANGMPLSAIVGRSDVMDEMEEIFFSGTFGGETLSLAASMAVLNKIEREPVIETLWKTGQALKGKIDPIIKESGLENTIGFCGLAPWHLLQVGNHGKTPSIAIKTFILHELYKQGVLSLGAHNICYAHTQADIEAVRRAYQIVLHQLAGYLKRDTLNDNMSYPAIKPVFEVRKSA